MPPDVRKVSDLPTLGVQLPGAMPPRCVDSDSSRRTLPKQIIIRGVAPKAGSRLTERHSLSAHQAAEPQLLSSLLSLYFLLFPSYFCFVETADVVIIGSGIVGSSVDYHLAQAGCTNVLVIEREAHQGKGSTGKSMGGVRAQFSTPVNIQMSRYSIDFFSKFDEIVGHPAD